MRRKRDRAYIDFETWSPFDPANIKPDDLVAVYFEEAGMIKRVPIDRPQLEFKNVVDETRFDLQIEHTIIMGGDLISGSVHTNTDPKLTAELSAWWQKHWYEAMMDACYGRLKPLDKPDEPRYTGIVKETP